MHEGSYWRALCLSQHTSVLRLLRHIVIEKSYASTSAALKLVHACKQVGTRAAAAHLKTVRVYKHVMAPRVPWVAHACPAHETQESGSYYANST